MSFPGTFPFTFGDTATPTLPLEPGLGTSERNSIMALNEELLFGDLITRAMAADEIADKEAPANQGWNITICDKFWGPVGSVGDDLIELTGTDPRNAVPTATMKIKGGSEHIETFMECTDTMVGVIVETGGVRFPFYVDIFDYEYKDGQWTGTASLLGIYDILNYLQIWPNFLLPIQAQIPSHAVFIWGLVTVLQTMVAECALRIQSGLWEFVNNALSLNPDIRAWFGTLLQSNGNIFQMLKTPVYVSIGNPLLDTSPLVARTVRMESCGTVIADITKAYGVNVEVNLWLPGDDQPDAWAFLELPTYVVTVKDRSQIEGPTKTVLDSVIRTVVDAGGSFFGEIPGIINQVPGMSGVYDAPLIGLNFVPPWAVLIAPDEGKKGSIESCKISHHTQKGWQHIIGGRSPKWVCPPRANNSRGTGPRAIMTQRFDERNLCMADRQHLHSHWYIRDSVKSAGGLPQQFVPRLPAHPELRSPQQGRAVPSRDRSHARDCLVAVQHRNRLRIHQRAMGLKGIRIGAGNLPKRRRLQARQGCLQRRARVGALHEPNQTVHRLRRTGQLPPHGHRTRRHAANRRRQSRRSAIRETSAIHHRSHRVLEHTYFGATIMSYKVIVSRILALLPALIFARARPAALTTLSSAPHMDCVRLIVGVPLWAMSSILVSISLVASLNTGPTYSMSGAGDAIDILLGVLMTLGTVGDVGLPAITITNLVSSVLFGGSPVQIVKLIIVGIIVAMAGLHTLGSWLNKVSEHQRMDTSLIRLPIFIQGATKITTVLRTANSQLRQYCSSRVTHTRSVRDLIVGKAGDRGPLFIMCHRNMLPASTHYRGLQCP